jgi:hypothetical protein
MRPNVVGKPNQPAVANCPAAVNAGGAGGYFRLKLPVCILDHLEPRVISTNLEGLLTPAPVCAILRPLRRVLVDRSLD